MGKPHAIVLNSGGLRSLVATALVLAEDEPVRVTLLHVLDGRESVERRREYVRQQAEGFGISRLTEVNCKQYYGHGYGRDAEGRPRGTLVGPRLLLTGLAEAKFQSAQRVVWPIAVDGQDREAARATEQALLCGHLVNAEEPFEDRTAPRVVTPLLEMTDAQVVELGAQLGVDWRLAWSCSRGGERACGACPGCRRRRAAFDKAGVVDDAERVEPNRRAG